MKTTKILLALIFISLFNSSFGQEEKNFASANDFYQKKEYHKAINIYNSLLFNGQQSYEIFYNLGNCWYKLDNYPKAILYYEKAKKIDNSDEDLNYNLNVANTKISDKIEVIPVFFLKKWWLQFQNIFSEKQWALVSIIFWIFTSLGAYLFFTTRKFIVKSISFWAGVTMLIISFITGFAGYNKYKESTQNNSAIVMTAAVNVKSSPEEESTIIFVIHQGTKVNLALKINDWYKIKLANGSTGWIKEEDLEII